MCPITRHYLPLFFSLLLLPSVTFEADAQSEGEDTERRDTIPSDSSTNTSLEGVSPDRIPLTVFVKEFPDGNSSQGNDEFKDDIFVHTHATTLGLSFWNLHVAWFDSEKIAYGLGVYLARGGEPNDGNAGFTGGFALRSEGFFYFNGIGFDGFYAFGGLTYARVENTSFDQPVTSELQLLDLGAGYAFNIGNVVSLNLFAGGGYPISGGEMEIPGIYFGDGGLGPVGGFDFGLIL